MVSDHGVKIIAVYGFLGSGKTTVMLQLARAIVAGGRKAALIVNEAGDVPVDGKLLEVSGLPVKEIFAGCICCTIVGDFIETLRTLRQDPTLAYILIEPSGMADAPNLFTSLEKHTFLEVIKLVILDGPRLPLLLKAAGTLIHKQVEVAGIILLNKIDALTPESRGEVQTLLANLHPHVSIHEVSALEGIPQEIVHQVLQ